MLAGFRVVVRVEDLAHGLGANLVLHRAVVVAFIENLEVEGFGGLGTPEAQQVGVGDAMPQHRGVIGDAADHLDRHPAHMRVPLVVLVALGVAADLDVETDLWPADLPRVAVMQPVVRDFDLPAIDDGLVENTMFIADAVADRRDFERRQRVHEAGRQPAEATVAQPRLLFLGQYLVEIEPEAGHCRARVVLDAEIDQVVGELRPGQVLRGEVAHRAVLAGHVRLRRRHPAQQHVVAHRHRQRVVAIRLRGDLERPSDREEQVVAEGVLERLYADTGAGMLETVLIRPGTGRWCTDPAHVPSSCRRSGWPAHDECRVTVGSMRPGPVGDCWHGRDHAGNNIAG